MSQVTKTFALASALGLNAGVLGDLPVHCLRHQVEGEWEFTLGQPSDIRSSCGHARPDDQNNEPALYHLDTDIASKLSVNLDMPNRASTASDSSGTFTMIYDEGFEVAVEGKNFFAFSRYDLDAAGNNQTHCGETLTGWYHDQEGGQYGCYYGIKKSGQSGDDVLNETPSMKKLNQNGFLSDRDTTNADSNDNFNPFAQESPLTEEFHQNVVNHLNSQPRRVDEFAGTLLQKKATTRREKTWKAKLYPSLINKTRKQINKMAGLKRSLGVHEAHINQHRPRPDSVSKTNSTISFLQQSLRSKLPQEVDWDKAGALDEVINQGDCGSCYTVATTRMLSARNRIKIGNNDAPPFSIGFPLHCSEYNQGCDGGYAFLQSKWSEDVGLLPEKCFSYDSTDRCDRAVDMDCVRSQGSYRAHNHRYIGGYYGGSDEIDIMEELAQNGPLVVSFEPKDDFMYYNSGVYSSSAERIHQEWERVDHAVLVVGYGETSQGQKFWKVQNSWGPEWGEKGFFRIARGENDSGIESISVAADVIETDSGRVEQFLNSRGGVDY